MNCFETGIVEGAEVVGERNGQCHRLWGHPKEWFTWLNHDRIVAGRSRVSLRGPALPPVFQLASR
jgi:hypothetical protein